MTKDAYTLTAPDGSTMELPIRSGTLGPKVLDIGRLYREQGVFTYESGFRRDRQLRQRYHVYRRRKGRAAVPRLSG